MNYCPKCGRQIMDESLGCPVCNIQDPVQSQNNTRPVPEEEVVAVKEFTVEDQNGNRQRFETPQDGPRSWESYQNTEPRPVPDQTIPTVLKAIILIAIFFAGGIGAIAGLIGGVILSKSPLEDYRKFGKTLIIFSSVMIAIWFLCCVVGGVFGTVGNMVNYY